MYSECLWQQNRCALKSTPVVNEPSYLDLEEAYAENTLLDQIIVEDEFAHVGDFVINISGGKFKLFFHLALLN